MFAKFFQPFFVLLPLCLICRADSVRATVRALFRFHSTTENKIAFITCKNHLLSPRNQYITSCPIYNYNFVRYNLFGENLNIPQFTLIETETNMKPNHKSLAYKMRMNLNKTYKDLRQKQKAKIAVKIYEKVKSAAIWVPYEEFHSVFLYKLPQYETRITESGLPEDVPPDPPKKPSTPKKRGNSNKVCPECGRKMKQQFIGLQHCKCGMSWHKGTGFFERTNDMVFALERRKVGKKIKQCPVIRYR